MWAGQDLPRHLSTGWMPIRLHAVGLAASLALLGSGCTSRMWRARFLAPEAATLQPPSPEAPFLKAHLKDGTVLVLDRWELDAGAGRISGSGLRFDAQRERVAAGQLQTSLDEVALLEATWPERMPRASVKTMAWATGISAGLSALLWLAFASGW